MQKNESNDDIKRNKEYNIEIVQDQPASSRQNNNSNVRNTKQNNCSTQQHASKCCVKDVMLMSEQQIKILKDLNKNLQTIAIQLISISEALQQKQDMRNKNRDRHHGFNGQKRQYEHNSRGRNNYNRRGKYNSSNKEDKNLPFTKYNRDKKDKTK